jgi:hypothetical protein
MDRDAPLRQLIYDHTRTRGMPPTIGELAAASGDDAGSVRDALSRLADARIVVLQPQSGELLMVPPFSAVPTPFVVETPHYHCFANCAWDALGVSVMLHEPVRIDGACGCCGEALRLTTARDEPPEGDAVIHFAVPARRWWDDIVFT